MDQFFVIYASGAKWLCIEADDMLLKAWYVIKRLPFDLG